MERYVILKPVQFKGHRYRIGDLVDGDIVHSNRAEALIRMKVIARVPGDSALDSVAEEIQERIQEPGQALSDAGGTSDPARAGRKRGVIKKEE